MGLVELMFVVVAAAVGVGSWFGIRRLWPAAPAKDAQPVPWTVVVVAVGSWVPAWVVGLMLGRWFAVDVIGAMVPLGEGASYVMTSPDAPEAAAWRGRLFLIAIMMLPGVAASSRLAFGSTRSSQRALVFGLATFVGALVFGGVALGLLSVSPRLDMPVGPPGEPIVVDLVYAISTTIKLLLAFCIGGALLAAAAVVAGTDRAGLHKALVSTTFMVPSALLVAALVTPPDVITQLIVAIGMGVCWLGGLGLGAIWLRAELRTSSP